MNFPNLEFLNCSDNNLCHIPPNINFPNLKELDCSHNNLYYIPLYVNCRVIYTEYHIDEYDETLIFRKRKIFI